MSAPPDLLPETSGPRAPRQDRSRRTLTRIVSATRRLLAQEGVGAVTVQSVVALAGASVGSFYARFSGKEDLLHYVQEEVWEDVAAWWRGAVDGEAWQSTSLEESVERAVGLLQESLGVMGSERHALRARPEGLATEDAFRVHLRRSLTEQVLVHRSAIGHPRPEAALDVGIRAVYGALLDVTAEAGPSIDGDDEYAEVRTELTRMLLGYLRGPSRDGLDSAPGRVDFFDVWG